MHLAVVEIDSSPRCEDIRPFPPVVSVLLITATSVGLWTAIAAAIHMVT